MSNKTAQNDFFIAEAPEASVAAAACRRVLVPYPVDKAYDYLMPEGASVQDGDYICVPLGGREVPGVVWGEAEGSVASAKLKAAVSIYDMPPMPGVHRAFIDWVAQYTMNAKGSVLKMSLSVPAALEPPPPVKGYRAAQEITDDKHKGLSPQRRKVLDVMADSQVRRAAEIAELAGCSAAVVKGLADAGYLQAVEITNPAPCARPDFHRSGPVLSEDQRYAADHLRAHVGGGYRVSLLDGVTGAGKTEVYFESVAKALETGKQVLILLPEIALSNAFLDRFKSRFGCTPALWHSNLTPVQRRNAWRGVAMGQTKVVVGARSALFLPYQDLGLIIVDEEHDPAYKQEEGVIYHARDMAIVRAHLGDIPIVLVSATPSLETMHNAWAKPHGYGRYDHVHLPDRFGGAMLPEIGVIDMRANKLDARHFISEPLKAEIEETLGRGEQALLFLNRRGYAPLTICRTCGHRIECPRCTAWLVEHKAQGKLQCHHCGFSSKPPKTCSSCNAEDSLTACGPGVERIFEEAKAYFPEARIMVLASDTAEDPESLRKMLEDIRERRVDLIIGTQIIAKGHHFPHLTLVGVIDADLGLQGGELRAAERTYQILHQVSGRAGREQKKGRVFLQTFMPEHRIMKALSHGGRDDFLGVEAMEREVAHMPPFSRLAGIIIAGRDESQVIAVAKELGACAPQVRGEKGVLIQTLGPAPAPFARLRGKYRYRLLVRAEKTINLQKTIADWLSRVKVPSTVRVYIDIDPQSFF
jgi:primosomal protein N' (replication factor Y)